ncbi:hypothetical protein ACFQ0G_29550 [Streptomyces chiangmaiensis]
MIGTWIAGGFLAAGIAATATACSPATDRATATAQVAPPLPWPRHARPRR